MLGKYSSSLLRKPSPATVSPISKRTTAVSSINLSASQWTNSPSKFDFRSDTVTTPTIRQLKALERASLGDDVFLESTTTNSFEERVADMFGKESAVFVLSGTMGNQLSLRSLLEQPPYSVLCDSRSHIYCSEAGGVSMWSQALPIPVLPRNGRYLTLEDIMKHAVVDGNIHYAPTKVICLENTVGGTIMPIEEVRRIAEWARNKGLKMHLDGARLWNVVSGGKTSQERIHMLKEHAREFDTVSVCFSKSLGAPVGSAIVSSKRIVEKARHFRKAMGGGVRQAGILTAMAEAAMDEVFVEGRLQETNDKARRIGNFWRQRCGGALQAEVETNMIWLDMRDGQVERFNKIAEEMGVKVSERRIIVHWQITDEAVDKLCAAMEMISREKIEDCVLNDRAAYHETYKR